jgi:neutral ceramidase
MTCSSVFPKTTLFALFAFLCGSLLSAADYKVGLATQVITPSQPIYLSGYASRTHPSDGVIQDLKGKALAVEDRSGGRLVIVTTDLIGLPRSLTDPVAARIQKSYGLERARLIFNSSHTHTGPMIASNLQLMFDLRPEEQQVIDDYTRKLADDLVLLAGRALQDLAPAALWFGNGQAHFGVNRRQPSPNGIRIGVNPDGPTDSDVPVLKVTAPDGRTRALLFAYACHNTTLTGDTYKISGDYAGFAQNDIEAANPGVTAMFLQSCAGDQNPNPRTKLENVEQHGRTLAGEVMRVAGGRMQEVRGKLRAAFQIVDLDFAFHTRDTFTSRLNDKNPWHVRHAKAMLKMYDEGHPIRRYPYPVQAVSFGRSLTILALGGEVVVDYCLRVKKEFGAKGILIAAYSNDVMSYIPTLRILKEGGYEPVDSMYYYGLPGPYADDTEERIFATIRQVMKRVGRKPAAP